jgi:hypothetical protein
MKKNLTLVFALLLTTSMLAQVSIDNNHYEVMTSSSIELQDWCGTSMIDMQNAQLNNDYLQSRKRLEEYYLSKKERDNSLGSRSIITIPVVFHIVNRAGELFDENDNELTDAIINTHMSNLNKNFKLQNPEFNSTPIPFIQLARDCEINFCLAARNPFGSYTSGIVRYSSSHSGSWASNYENIKNPSAGGVAPWDPSKYLNIWVTPLEGNLGGYSSFPGSAPSLDGVVMARQSLRIRPFSQDITQDGSDALTHEIGHWLGLEHIWGPNGTGPTALCGDDGIDDTPPQQGPTYNGICPIPFPTISRCPINFPNGNYPYGNMAWNFMDYSICQTMFTKNQKERMRATLDGPRGSIQFSDGCTLPTPYISLVRSICIGGTEYEGEYQALPQISDPNIQYIWATNSINIGGGYNYFSIYQPSVEPGQTINLTVQLQRGNLTSTIAGGNIGIECSNNFSTINSDALRVKKNKRKELEISPNPVSDNLLLSIEDKYANCPISIIDQYGSSKINFKYTVESQRGVDVRNLSNGLYFVVLRTNEGEMITKKFIISR